jgi:hypothetical protein
MDWVAKLYTIHPVHFITRKARQERKALKVLFTHFASFTL